MKKKLTMITLISICIILFIPIFESAAMVEVTVKAEIGDSKKYEYTHAESEGKDEYVQEYPIEGSQGITPITFKEGSTFSVEITTINDSGYGGKDIYGIYSFDNDKNTVETYVYEVGSAYESKEDAEEAATDYTNTTDPDNWRKGTVDGDLVILEMEEKDYWIDNSTYYAKLAINWKTGWIASREMKVTYENGTVYFHIKLEEKGGGGLIPGYEFSIVVVNLFLLAVFSLKEKNDLKSTFKWVEYSYLFLFYPFLNRRRLNYRSRVKKIIKIIIRLNLKREREIIPH